MSAPKLTLRLFWAAEVLLLAATVIAAAWISSPQEWHPLALVVLTLALAFVGQWFTVETSSGILSASVVAIVLAMALLGPVPAAACGIVAGVMHSAVRRRPPAQWLNNLLSFPVVAFVGGLVVGALAPDIHSASSQQLAQSAVFGMIVLGAFIVALALNFVIVGLDVLFDDGRSLARQMGEFLPLLSGELAAGALAALLAVAYRSAGLPVLFGAIVLLLIFQHLTVALLRSEDRAEQLEARSRQLVGLQLGVLRTLVRALGMRDGTTARHAASVAQYARALASEAGCGDEERDAIHAAGLLHEIGKFTWPDRVLHADVIPDEDLAIVRNHPREGAILVGALDGYGPVADAILYHHERIDGRGYPAGLIGKEIPLSSRILAICCTYHTMITGQAHRQPMTPEEAVEELRNGSRNGQLDGELTDVFAALLQREGSTFAENADFETELEFERRVREMAEPPASHATPRSPQGERSRMAWRSGVSGVRQRALKKH